MRTEVSCLRIGSKYYSAKWMRLERTALHCTVPYNLDYRTNYEIAGKVPKKWKAKTLVLIEQKEIAICLCTKHPTYQVVPVLR